MNISLTTVIIFVAGIAFSIPGLSEPLHCQSSQTGSVYFESCRGNDGRVWTKTSIDVGEKSYLNGRDINGNLWSGIREFKGKESITSYHNQNGEILATTKCHSLTCKDKLIEHYQIHGVLLKGHRE